MIRELSFDKDKKGLFFLFVGRYVYKKVIDDFWGSLVIKGREIYSSG